MRSRRILEGVAGVAGGPFHGATTGYDLTGRRTFQTVYDSATQSVQTKFGYDGAGRLTKVIPGYGAPDHTVTQYNYDELGNLT